MIPSCTPASATRSRIGRNPRYSMATWPRSRTFPPYDMSVRRLLYGARMAVHGEREVDRARKEDGHLDADVRRDVAGAESAAPRLCALPPRARQLLQPRLPALGVAVVPRGRPRPHRLVRSIPRQR